MSALEQVRALPYWVCYTPDKMPVDPKSGRLAKAGVPATWGTYEQALAYQAQHHDFVAGIGREIGPGEGLVFLDLDHCRSPHSGAMTPLAARVLNSISSYAEVSPSGCGIHILAYGEIPGSLGADPRATPENRLEMYAERRYFTWTGNRVTGTPDHINYWRIPLLLLYEEVRKSRVRDLVPGEVPGRKHAHDHETTREGLQAYASTALERVCHEVASCPEGFRNRTLYMAALKLGQFCQYNLLDEQEVRSMLQQAGYQCGLSGSEIMKAICKGIEIGISKPPRTRKFDTLLAHPVAS